MTDLTWNDPEGDTAGRYRDPERIRKMTMAHETVYRMWEGGIRDMNEIEIETGYSKSYIRSLLRLRGYEVSAARVRSTEEVVAICADYSSGMKVKDVLKKWGITNNTLYAYLDEQGVPNRTHDPNYKKGRRDFMDVAVKMYLEGMLIKDIVAETGIVPSTLYQELTDREIPLRGHFEPNRQVSELAVQMYKDHRPVVEIMAETGVGSSALYAELRAQNVPIQRGRDLAKRLSEATTMYQMGAFIENIYKETGINTTMLYRELRKRGIPKRNRTGGMAQGHNVEKALELYDKGAKATEIVKTTGVSTMELATILKERGEHLRSGLSTRVTARSLEYAVRGYESGLDFETIEIDTLVTRPQLMAELKKRSIVLRP